MNVRSEPFFECDKNILSFTRIQTFLQSTYKSVGDFIMIDNYKISFWLNLYKLSIFPTKLIVNYHPLQLRRQIQLQDFPILLSMTNSRNRVASQSRRT